MKKIIMSLMFLAGVAAMGQNKNAKASLEVDGVCMMCKDRIEKACIKTKGVKSAIWNVDTHELKLIYDERKTNLDSIQKNIVAVGHDTQEMTASEEAYNTVHACCRYRDEEVKSDHQN
ncbi:heavy-metal-associated domain-containing protein [Mangrovimonas sp. YM274]|uniref:heavy-metal-associated domain-containing protein n=1 Tax=Mangrovimonas sp. YM274 TaxID=3070660 RepID=UPI0027DD9A53|nr:heavy-metal-associated domain-containing protein [Mangrovimonas sp. YM274]WMI68310.1 heavy-metal-associated domain-containing protein [Mangrovimonas sp. YM274]